MVGGSTGSSAAGSISFEFIRAGPGEVRPMPPFCRPLGVCIAVLLCLVLSPPKPCLPRRRLTRTLLAADAGRAESSILRWAIEVRSDRDRDRGDVVLLIALVVWMAFQYRKRSRSLKASFREVTELVSCAISRGLSATGRRLIVLRSRSPPACASSVGNDSAA